MCFYPWTGADRLREDLPDREGGVCVTCLPHGAQAQARGAEFAIGDKFNQQGKAHGPCMGRRVQGS